MLTIGLTGGIGSGKSRVADLLEQWGAAVVDTDVIARELTGPQGAAMPSVREAFGPALITPEGSMDRDAMRELAFSDPDALARLQGILHPLIRESAHERARSAAGPYLVFVVPLLVESGRWRDQVDRICVVDCDPQTQIARVQNRSGLTVEAIARIMSAQASRADRLAQADDILCNDGKTSLAELTRRARALHEYWLKLAAGRPCPHHGHARS